MPHEQVVELVRLAASPAAGDREALLVHLRAIIPANSRFPAEAVARFLAILREQPVEDAKLADRFAQIAEQHVQLLQEIRQFRVGDPEVQALRDAAAAALQGAPDHDLARAKLEEARRLVQAKRMAVARVLADQQREEAALVREQAGVEAARLRFAEAARLYEQAAGLLPAENRDRRGADLFAAGEQWSERNSAFFGTYEVPALERAVAAYRAALEELTRERAPLQRAAALSGLGDALVRLSERESGTTQLQEAIGSYRAALEELTRERPQLQWAVTQSSRLQVEFMALLSDPKADTARLQEATAAYRAALEEFNRDSAGLQWIDTQSALGVALWTLRKQEAGTGNVNTGTMSNSRMEVNPSGPAAGPSR